MNKLLFIFLFSNLIFAEEYVSKYCTGNLKSNANGNIIYEKYICIDNNLFLLHSEGFGKYKTGYSIPLNKKCKCSTKNIKTLFGTETETYIKVIK